MSFSGYSNYGYLSGQLLIGTSVLKGSCFERSVIYLCAHGSDGAMGIVVNHLLEDVTCSDIFEGFNNSFNSLGKGDIYFGGPVNSERGFILHTSDYACVSTQKLQDNFSVSSTLDILEDISVGKGPREYIIALGYSGWGPGQLESELKENAWVCAPASEDIIFKESNDCKWKGSAASVGIDMGSFSGVSGHA